MAGDYLVTVAAVEVGIVNDLFNEFVSEVILTDLLASWIGDVASCVAKRDPLIPVDFVPDKPLAGCASFVPERSTEERSFVIIGIVEANMRSTLRVLLLANNAPTLRGNKELSKNFGIYSKENDMNTFLAGELLALLIVKFLRRSSTTSRTRGDRECQFVKFCFWNQQKKCSL